MSFFPAVEAIQRSPKHLAGCGSTPRRERERKGKEAIEKRKEKEGTKATGEKHRQNVKECRLSRSCRPFPHFMRVGLVSVEQLVFVGLRGRVVAQCPPLTAKDAPVTVCPFKVLQLGLIDTLFFSGQQ